MIRLPAHCPHCDRGVPRTTVGLDGWSSVLCVCGASFRLYARLVEVSAGSVGVEVWVGALRLPPPVVRPSAVVAVVARPPDPADIALAKALACGS